MLHKRSYGSVEIVSVDRPALLQELERAVRGLRAAHPEVRQVFLFGSFARGDHTPESDLDLLVVVSGTELPFLQRADPYRDAFRHLPFDTNLVVYREGELLKLRQDPSSLAAVALAEAVTLS